MTLFAIRGWIANTTLAHVLVLSRGIPIIAEYSYPFDSETTPEETVDLSLDTTLLKSMGYNLDLICTGCPDGTRELPGFTNALRGFFLDYADENYRIVSNFEKLEAILINAIAPGISADEPEEPEAPINRYVECGIHQFPRVFHETDP